MTKDSISADRRTMLKAAGIAGVSVGATTTAGCLDLLGIDDDQVTITMSEVASTPDPNDHNATSDYNSLDPVYEPLLQVDEEGNIEEHVITDWVTDSDTIELTIRDDVQFHNGDDLTASDVAYTINRQVDDDVGVVSPQDDGMIGITEAEAVNDTTIEVSHESNPDLAMMGIAVFGRAMNEEWTADNADDEDGTVSGDMNGTGPYQLEDFSQGDYYEFTVFDDYWGETPDVEEIRLEAVDEDTTRRDRLLADETEFVTNLPPEDIDDVEGEDDLRTETITSYRNIFLAMPNDDGPFDSKDFRQAMNYAIDNEEVLNSIFDGYGEPMSQPIPEGIFGHNPELDPYEQDQDLADDLIEQSGYTDEELVIHVPNGRYINDVNTAEYVASQIDELDNVSCEHEVRDFGELVEEILDGDLETSPDIYLIGWGNPTHDANYGLEPWFVEGQSSYAFEDSELEQRIIDSQTIEDTDEREEELQEINEYIHDEAPWVFLHRQESIYGVHEDIDWSPRSDERINPETMEE
ncbi:peptide ABC transporter substrate-binding protein [Salinarchaeum sp. IM2453]|uniref:ABC transporter substrate-binding protein n=1 Tax=Salinarchaeum sp. IM2453 TaxID=2862870 RepID=UPI001C82FEC5|nr:ABC transporter substrate-binding protein [Salinarchaeum sp. IM2453]QZA88040.1 peptide ABC transporter substrate-binding protein [Salinarchaeum sp. IM2453]